MYKKGHDSMLNIIETLGVSWSSGNLIYQYLTGAVWWAWMIDAGFLVAGIVSGGLASLMKSAAQFGLKQAIKNLSKRSAILL